MVDLINLISQNDKDSMINYIRKTNSLYDENDFVGLDTYLENWSKSKQRLFYLLGDTLILEEDFCLEKTKDDMIVTIKEYIFEQNCNRDTFIFCFDKKIRELYEVDVIDDDTYNVLRHALSSNCIYENKLIPKSFEVIQTISLSRKDFETAGFRPKRDLKLSYGMGLMKALKKVNDFFNFELDKEFEQFRIEISQIFNDKFIKGTICYSIHPFDYMTMSDNASGWSSCMNWTESNGGCYHAGTVEMMNSNNVICCYIKSTEKLFRYRGIEWNNKKWRQLLYVTPEIICGGWAYPYQNSSITTFILNKLRELAKSNLSWTYEFGPEYYKDMNHIYSLTAMDNQKWYRQNDAMKHNIIFDTKMMYNDFLNKCYDYTESFLCIRNKVKKNTIISVSGKCNCLRCNSDLQVFKRNETYDYNERYASGSLLCRSCKEDLQCVCCKSIPTKFNMLRTKDGKHICEYCYHTMRLCPCCNRPFTPDKLNYTLQGKTGSPSLSWDDLSKIIKERSDMRFIDGALYGGDIVKELDKFIYIYGDKDEKYADMTFKEFLANIKETYQPVDISEYNGFLDIFMCGNCMYELIKKKKFKEYSITKESDGGWPFTRKYYAARMDYIGGVKYNNYRLENLKMI